VHGCVFVGACGTVPVAGSVCACMAACVHAFACVRACMRVCCMCGERERGRVCAREGTACKEMSRVCRRALVWLPRLGGWEIPHLEQEAGQTSVLKGGEKGNVQAETTGGEVGMTARRFESGFKAISKRDEKENFDSRTIVSCAHAVHLQGQPASVATG
jgi:hypothetical protein